MWLILPKYEEYPISWNNVAYPSGTGKEKTPLCKIVACYHTSLKVWRDYNSRMDGHDWIDLEFYSEQEYIYTLF